MGTNIPTAPGAPTGLTAIPGSTQISLNWTAPASNGGSAIDYYVIYQDGSPLVAHPTGLTTTITGLTNGQSYVFNVSAHNAIGLGVKSVGVAMTPFTIPNVPTGLTAVPGDTQVILNWTAPAFNGGNAITGYKLYSSATETGTYALIASPSGTTYTNTGLTNSQTYWYKVSAVNAAGEGAKTGQISSVPYTVPGVPTGLTAIGGNAQVYLNWTAPVFDGGRIIDYYVIYQDGSPLVAHATGLTTIVTGLTNGQSYTFNVAAHNLAGTGPQTGGIASTPFTIPNAPTGLTAFTGDTHVTLNWTAPVFDGGRSIDYYVIYQDGSPLVDHVTGLTTIVTGLTNGQSYTFNVAAHSSAGIGSLSVSCVIIPYTVPSRPVLTTATAGYLNVTLVWTAPTSSGYSPLTGYETYFGTSVVNTTWTKFSTVGASVLSEKITGLTAGTTYYFGVKALNIGGGSVISNNLTAVPYTISGAPTLSTATPGLDNAVLVWTAPANNGGSPITGYLIFYGLSDATTQFGGIQPATPLRVNVTGLIGGTHYYFAVKAVNAAGNSPMSNVLNVTTVMGVPGTPTGLTATAVYGKVTLTWTAPANTGGSPIIDYKVYRGISAASVAKIGNSSLATYVDVTATPGSTYYYKVSAVNVLGEGNQSASATALVPTLVPVTGKIVDANGNVLAGITVALENGSSVLTDAQGNFTILASPGNHTLTISGPGIDTKKVDASVSTSGLTIGSISTSKASGSDSTLSIVAVAVIAVLLVVLLIVIVRRRKKIKQ
jgi:titin